MVFFRFLTCNETDPDTDQIEVTQVRSNRASLCSIDCMHSVDLGIWKSALSKYKLQIMNFKVKSRNLERRKRRHKRLGKTDDLLFDSIFFRRRDRVYRGPESRINSTGWQWQREFSHSMGHSVIYNGLTFVDRHHNHSLKVSEKNSRF